MTDKRKVKQAKSNKRKQIAANNGVARDEFRKRRKGGSGHPEYIYRKVGNKFEFIGITHAPITRGVKNIKLDKNPNPADENVAYIKPTPERRSTSEFHKKPLKGWKFAASDIPKVEKVKAKGQKKKSDNN